MKRTLFENVFRIGIVCMLSVMPAGCSARPGLQPAAEQLTTATTALTKPATAALTNTPSSTRTPVKTPTATTTPVKQPLLLRRDDWGAANQIRAMLIDQNGNLWAGGPNSIVRWDTDTGQHTAYVFENVERFFGVETISQTTDQAVWFGTFGNGIYRIDRHGNWRLFTTADGLPSDYIASLAAAPDGRLWVDTHRGRDLKGGSFGLFDGSKWVAGVGGGFFKIAATPDSGPWGLVLLQAGQFFDSYVGFYDGEKWETNFDFGNNIVTAITIAPDGTVWAGSQKAIFHHTEAGWHIIVPPWSATDAEVTSIQVTQDGTVWFGFSRDVALFGFDCINHDGEYEFGVYRFKDQKWTHFTEKDGLIDNEICDIAVGPDGSVYFGSNDKGISRFDGQRWTAYVIQE